MKSTATVFIAAPLAILASGPVVRQQLGKVLGILAADLVDLDSARATVDEDGCLGRVSDQVRKERLLGAGA